MTTRRRSFGRSARHGQTDRRVDVAAPRRRRRAMCIAILGVLLIGASVLMLSRDRALPQAFGEIPGQAGQSDALLGARAGAEPDRVVGPLAAISSTSSESTSSDAPAHSSTPATHPRPASIAPSRTPSPADTTAAPALSTSGPVGPPERLLLPSQGVTAAVTQVVTSPDGVLRVPDDPAQVGWWMGSALPGSAAGTTVLDGHIDSATAGVGAFWRLSALDAGASVAVRLRGGHTVQYRVVARRVYPKNAGLPASLFTLTGPPTLLLISCGGPFDAARGSYEDNIAVFAVPVR